ncbi:interactor of constitutive active ROPs 4 isoform X2 [Jatropha curcas]|nr:interactor of constitutive active ROPs 4 isoform X2 [Jatropha curcas]XP_020537763.1 interactor of constitutive active ROPs 4 isoform X2 [Jatropha curcas]
MPQRQSTRGPHPLSSESDSHSLHHRSVRNPSSKLGDRRSPRGPHTESLDQKKLGTRIADLESQLGQAQEELKILKEQLASAEAAKKELETNAKKPVALESEGHPSTEIQHLKIADSNAADEISNDNLQETDVSQVPIEKDTVEAQIQLTVQVEKGKHAIEITQPPEISKPDEPSFPDLALKDDEINMLKAKLENKEHELEIKGNENKHLKNLLNEANSSNSVAKEKEEEMLSKLSQMGKELEESQANADHLKGKLEAAEEAREALETEIRKMRVQTEQWRKAADAAAAVLAGAVEINGRITERCGSMDKHFGDGVFESPAGFVGSPGVADDFDYGFGSGKRKGSGIKMFGDLWKKKGHK